MKAEDRQALQDAHQRKIRKQQTIVNAAYQTYLDAANALETMYREADEL